MRIPASAGYCLLLFASAATAASAPDDGAAGGALHSRVSLDSCIIGPPGDSCMLSLAGPDVRSVGTAYAGDANLPAGGGGGVLHRVNRAPVTAADSYATDQDGSLAVNALSGVLANDDDDDGDALAVTPGRLQAGGIGGSVLLRADGSFVYTPPAYASGIATFSYTALDGIDSDSGRVNIVVRPASYAPAFAPGTGRAGIIAPDGAADRAPAAGR